MTIGWPYSALVDRHFAQPANLGPLPGDSQDVYTGIAGARASGIQVEFQARIAADQIEEIAFRAFGCPHSIAACSLATEWLTAQPAHALAKTRAAELAAALDVPPEKTGRLLVVEDALHQCFLAWDNRGLAGK